MHTAALACHNAQRLTVSSFPHSGFGRGRPLVPARPSPREAAVIDDNEVLANWYTSRGPFIAMHMLELHKRSQMPTSMPLGSAGVGMQRLQLTAETSAILEHSHLRHASLQRMEATSRRVTGLRKIVKSGILALNNKGCDTCNAYKIKIAQPKAKPRDEASDETDSPLSLVYFDQFGPVETASDQGFHYGAVFVAPKRNYVYLSGLKTLKEDEMEYMLAQTILFLEAKFGCKITTMRVDCLSTTRGKQLLHWFVSALINLELTPPGQHAYLGDVERYMYILFISTLIALRAARTAPRMMWFRCMLGAADVENLLSSRLSSNTPMGGYEAMTGRKQDASDLWPS